CGDGVPEPHDPIMAAARNNHPVRGQRNAPDRAGVTTKCCQRPAGAGVPQAHNPVSSTLATRCASPESATLTTPLWPCTAQSGTQSTSLQTRTCPVDVPAASKAPFGLSATDEGKSNASASTLSIK